jgi:hypothetical protein
VYAGSGPSPYFPFTLHHYLFLETHSSTSSKGAAAMVYKKFQGFGVCIAWCLLSASSLVHAGEREIVPEKAQHPTHLEVPRQLASQKHFDPAEVWPAVKKQMIELHRNKNLRALAKTKGVDIVLASGINFYGTASGGYYRLVTGELVFSERGLSFRSETAFERYTKPSFVRGFWSSGFFVGSVTRVEKRNIATIFQGRNLVREVEKNLQN